MKKLLILLFSALLLSSSYVFADDISDYQIEGISIGDSLLDYMTEDEILKEIKRTKDWYKYLNEPDKYSEVFSSDRLDKNLKTYDYLGFYIKNNQPNQYVTNKNEEYIIQSITGNRDYIENFDACLNKRDEIANLLSRSFPNAQKTEHFLIHGGDPSGKSIIDAVYFNFDSGAVVKASCYNFDEDFRRQVYWSEGLIIAIETKEIVEWLSDH